MCICILHSVLNPVDAVGVWGRGHKLLHKGQYWVTDRVNTINMRLGWVQSARTSENGPALNAWKWLFWSLVNYSITTHGQEFHPSVLCWVCKGWRKICNNEQWALPLHSWFSMHQLLHCFDTTPVSTDTVITFTRLHQCDAPCSCFKLKAAKTPCRPTALWFCISLKL